MEISGQGHGYDDDEEDDSGECDRWDDENNDLTKMKLIRSEQWTEIFVQIPRLSYVLPCPLTRTPSEQEHQGHLCNLYEHNIEKDADYERGGLFNPIWCGGGHNVPPLSCICVYACVYANT